MSLDDAPHVLIFPKSAWTSCRRNSRPSGSLRFNAPPGGIPSPAGFDIDYFISSDLWNREAAAHYSERLSGCRNFRSITNLPISSLSRDHRRNLGCADSAVV